MELVPTEVSETTREHWRRVLGAGGTTTLPRWSAAQEPGVRGHQQQLSPDLLVAIEETATRVGVPTAAVLLAAHAMVLAAVSGEHDVVTGWGSVSGRPAQPVRLTVDDADPARLLTAAARALDELAAHGAAPVAEIARELGVDPAPYETVLELADPGACALPDGVVAAVGLTDGILRVAHRAEILDDAAAARLCGYHRAALERLTGTGAASGSLLDDAERRYQLDGLAGPTRPRPQRPAHALFEDRVRAHPDAVAAVHGSHSLSYAELNARANRLARTLAARGLGREDVVAVVTERNLDWLTAVLGILKAGAVYLPIEPHFPTERIATVLARADCALVLTEADSRANLPDGPALLVAEAADSDLDPTDLDLPITGDQAAYIYFTSGSTGLPKGALCEHAGMVNHLFAKIEDLGIGEGTVVAQTAPQCFDISLWQLVAGLLVGGQTVIVAQEVILDAARFVATLVDRRVNVAQLVPSYLEVVLTLLEDERPALPDLRCVSATGEALKKELVQRWFAAQPGIALVNAYGLTETSDDTNHAVLRAVPETDRVPLGAPIPNVRVYVVDEHLEPVPLGAPGEIVFSGVCVGRGYVNDPERTAAAFGEDPHRRGDRLYRSGDHGRWLPDGQLEFLGRRDTQVKIRGFRIEIGEVDNALLRVPGVRDGAVVVAERADGSRHLVAFYYSGPEPIADDVIAASLAASLPEYMVPAAYHWRATLPLTANGKIDRKTLTAEANTIAAAAPAEQGAAPRTDVERRVAAAFADVLRLRPEEIGRDDSFFERGGTSLSAVKLVLALDRAVTLKDVARNPVLADLAAVLSPNR